MIDLKVIKINTLIAPTSLSLKIRTTKATIKINKVPELIKLNRNKATKII